MSTLAPEIQETFSPYWLRLHGHWVHLEGVQPENDVVPNRAFSELTTVDGYRYVQRAPRGPRTWNLAYDRATAAATAALEAAAYDYNFDDPNMRTLFLDTNDAEVNMVPPDLITSWSNPNFTSGPLVFNVGESEGQPIWLPTYDGDGVSSYRALDIPVRGGVTYTATAWTTLPSGNVALQISGAAVDSANGAAGATEANPHQATIVFTPVADGVVTVETAVGFTAGLMVYEGDCEPNAYRAGRRTPCSIAVLDPALSINPIFPRQNCDPCALPRETSTFVLQEVAMDAITPLDVGVS
jgi:hypothetical protein